LKENGKKFKTELSKSNIRILASDDDRFAEFYEYSTG